MHSKIDYQVCGKKHQKMKYAYKCHYCGMVGSQVFSKCYKEFPELMKRHRSRSSSRSRGKFDAKREAG